MAKVEPLGKEMNLVKKSFADVFAGKALAWQLGGTMVAALLFGALFFAALNVIDSSPFGALMLMGLAFVVAYVMLGATGCLVARVLDQKDEAEAGVAPLHFLIDNIGSALLLPLVIAAGSIVVCLVLYLYFLLWRTSVGQGIAVIFLPVFFVIALVLILKVFAFLFVGPAMIVKEGLSFNQCLSRLYHLGMRRRTESAKLFGTGLVMTVGALIPITLVLFSALVLLCAIWFNANIDLITTQIQQALGGSLQAQRQGLAALGGFTQFVLVVYFWGILVAPLLTIPLAMMNAVTLNCYDDVVGEVEDADADDEEGEAPAAGEEPDVIVEGEGDAADADETKAE
jgi:hypothetical protein